MDGASLTDLGFDPVADLRERFEASREQFWSAEPFPHIALDDVLPPAMFAALEAAVPAADSSEWWIYNNPLERKYACNRLRGPLLELSRAWNSTAFTSMVARALGFKDLVPEIGLNGAGMHMTRRGGKLDVHLDHNRNDKLPGYYRRLNMIYWIHDTDWQPDWGGSLELWHSEDGLPTRRGAAIVPKANRAALFECSGRSFHGHPDPLMCPQDVARKSLALYFFSSEDMADYDREKVLYVPRPEDPEDPELERLRSMRASAQTAAKVYTSED